MAEWIRESIRTDFGEFLNRSYDELSADPIISKTDEWVKEFREGK